MTKEAISQSVFEQYLKKWNSKLHLVSMGLMLVGVWAIAYIMAIAIGILDKELLRQTVLGIPMFFYVGMGLLCLLASYLFYRLMIRNFLANNYFMRLYLPERGWTYFLMSNGQCLSVVESIEFTYFPSWFRDKVKELNYDNEVKPLLKIPNHENRFSLEIQMTTNSSCLNWVQFFDNVCDPQRELTNAQEKFIDQIVGELTKDFPVNLTEQELQVEFVKRIPEIKKIIQESYYSCYWIVEQMDIVREFPEEVDLTFVSVLASSMSLLDNSAQQGEEV